MTHDFTYLNQLNISDLLSETRRLVNDLAPSVKDHALRALADRLEEYADACDTVNSLEAELADANQRADGWREEAQAVQRQLDQVRG
jgi:signal transduction histidine kinase